MKTVSQEVQELSINSLESTLTKLSNVYTSMTECAKIGDRIIGESTSKKNSFCCRRKRITLESVQIEYEGKVKNSCKISGKSITINK